MIYNSALDWQNAVQKRVVLFGMSGLGKTHVSNMLRASGDWFHYSIDYRIGTRYLGELIADNAKAEAMKVPFLRAAALSRRAVFARDDHRCQYCGDRADSIDHVMPRSRGGQHTANVRSATSPTPP